MEFKWKNGVTLINMEKGEKLLVNHNGSVRFLEVEVDNYSDLCFKSRENLKVKK